MGMPRQLVSSTEDVGGILPVAFTSSGLSSQQLVRSIFSHTHRLNCKLEHTSSQYYIILKVFTRNIVRVTLRIIDKSMCIQVVVPSCTRVMRRRIPDCRDITTCDPHILPQTLSIVNPTPLLSGYGSTTPQTTVGRLAVVAYGFLGCSGEFRLCYNTSSAIKKLMHFFVF